MKTDVEIYGRKCTLTATAHVHIYVESPEGESRFVEVPLRLEMERGEPVLRMDSSPVREAIHELALAGALERERDFRERRQVGLLARELGDG